MHEETSSRAIKSIFKFFGSKENYVQVVNKLPEELVAKTEAEDEQELVTKSEDEPVTKAENEQEPVTKTEEELATNIDKRVEDSGHHSLKKFPEPEGNEETCPCCVIV